MEGHTDVVGELVTAGAELECLNFHNQTPLLVAVVHSFDQLVNTLLKRGADPEAHDDEGYTALHCAILNKNGTIVASLLDRKVDVNAKDLEGNTPLHMAAEIGMVNFVQFLVFWYRERSNVRCAISWVRSSNFPRHT